MSNNYSFNKIQKNALGFIINAGVFLSLTILLKYAERIGNYFENERYFLAVLFVPALVYVLILMLLKRYVPIRFLEKLNSLIGAVMGLIMGIKMVQFEAYYADALFYHIGYSMIYNRELFSGLLVVSFGGIYLGVLNLTETLRKSAPSQINTLKVDRFKGLWDIFALMNLTVLILLFIPSKTSASVYYLSISFAFIVHFLFSMTLEVPGDEKSEKPEENGSSGKSRFKNGSLLLFLSLFVLAFAVGFLGEVDFIRTTHDGTHTQYFLNNPFKILNEWLYGFFIFCVLYPILRGLFLRLFVHDENLPFKGLKLVFIGFLMYFAVFILQLSGAGAVKIGYSRVLYPFATQFVGVGILIYLISRRNNPGSFLIWAFFLGGFTFWAGLLLAGDPAEEFSYNIFTILFVSALILLTSQAFLSKKHENVPIKVGDAGDKAESNADKNASERNLAERSENVELSGKSFINNLPKSVKVFLLIVILMVPAFSFIGTAAASDSEFQIIADINGMGILYKVDPMTRVAPDFIPEHGLGRYSRVNNTVDIYAAKNEWEPLHLVMRPINQDFMALYDISFSGFAPVSSPDNIIIPANTSTFEAYKALYLETHDDRLEDMLERFSMIIANDGKNHPLWLNFYVPADTPAGDYIGTVYFSFSNNSQPNQGFYRGLTKTLNVRLHVRNFRLPSVPTLKSNFGFYTSRPEFDEVIQMFKSHRMMHWAFFTLPRAELYPNGSISAINFTTMDEQINKIYGYGTYTIGFFWTPSTVFPEGTFVVNGKTYDASNYSSAETYDTTCSEYFALLEAHTKSMTYVDDFNRTHTWYDDIYFNGFDEIDAASEERIEEALALYDWLKNNASMTFPIMQTTGYHEEILSHVDIWCKHGIGEDLPEFKEWRESGKEMWIYTTQGPRYPNPTLSTAVFPIQARAIAWQCFVFNISHYLIWDTATPYGGDYGYGYQGYHGGTIMYKINGEYLPSIRMELVREGFEDYDYFYLLNYSLEQYKLTHPNDKETIAQAQELLDRTADLFVYGYNTIMDYRVSNSLRLEIGAMLDKICVLR